MVTNYLVAFCQSVTILVFALAVYSKGRDVAHFAHTISNFQLLPTLWSVGAAWIVIAAEASVVILLIVGWHVVGFAIATALLLLFSIALISVIARSLQTTCNCFGVSVRPVELLDLVRNSGLLIVALTGFALAIGSSVLVALPFAGWAVSVLAGVLFVVIWLHLGEITRLLGS